MSTLENPQFVEGEHDNKTENKGNEKPKVFEVEKPHQSPEFYEVHKHIENLLAFLSSKISQKEAVDSLRGKIENSLLLDGVEADIEYGKLSSSQNEDSNRFVESLSSDGNLPEKDRVNNKEDLNTHIENSEKLKLLKHKILEFYEKADEKTKEKLESIRKTVERVMLETNAFIIYTFLQNDESSHSTEQNTLEEDTIKYKLDTILTLEPSIITSSVIPGTKQQLPKGKMGVVLSGGDLNTVKSVGANNESNVASNSSDIHKSIADKSDRQYNEILVTNPQLFGFVLNVNVDETGGVYDFKTSVKEDAVRFKSDFMRTMDFAKSRGLPQLVMTPDRRMFSFVSINDDGVVNIGEEITPEQIAKSKTNMTKEKRKELAESLV